MTQTDIQLLLLRILAPIMDFEQPSPSPLQKLESVLKTLLTQNELFLQHDIIRSSMPATDPPSAITAAAIDTLAQSIFASIGDRPPGEAVFWMRERSVPFLNAPNDPVASQLVPNFSLGPFQLSTHDQVWYDFYEVHNQLAFYATEDATAPYLVVHHTAPFVFPRPGRVLTLKLCTIWLNSTAICEAPAPHNVFIPVRARACTLQFSTFLRFTNPLRIVLPPAMILTLKCSPEAAPVDASQESMEVEIPASLAIQFIAGAGTFEHVDKCSATLLGTPLQLQEATGIRAKFLTTHALLYIPLPSESTEWGPSVIHSRTFTMSGQAPLSQAGWYFQPVFLPPTMGIAVLGAASTAGYVGTVLEKGLSIKWEGLEYGALKPTSVLVYGGNGRIAVSSVHDPVTDLQQTLPLWEESPGTDHFSLLSFQPHEKLPQQFISDAAGYEFYRLYANTDINFDRPLSGNSSRFDANLFGQFDTFYFDNAVLAILIALTAASDNNLPIPEQLKHLHSIALENVLLTVKAPPFIFVKATGNNLHQLRAGTCVQYFPIHRIVHTLPDPYISSVQPEPHEPNDTMPPQIALLCAVTKWQAGTETQMILKFADKERQLVTPKVTTTDRQMSEEQQQNDSNGFYMHPCQLAYNPDLVLPLQKPDTIGSYPAGISNQDNIDNLIGSFIFLQWFPGNISLVDVSGRASQMGVAFTAHDSLDANVITQRHLENTGYSSQFPFQLKGMELVSSGRLVRAFTLPHIQWEPLTYIPNSNAESNADMQILNELSIFHSNGAPTRIASGNKEDVALTPKKVVAFIHSSYYNPEKQHASAAHFSLPFGMCAVAYFKPEKDPGDEALPFADLQINQPDFVSPQYGALHGALQVAAQAKYSGDITRNPDPYFHGSALQVVVQRNPAVFPIQEQSVLGRPITKQFNEEFFGSYDNSPVISHYSERAKVPLQRIDFSGYGASIFSNWQDKSAQFGAVSQVQFNVMLGRTGHEVVQIRSLIIPWAIPVVRSVIMHRQNHGLVTRYDTGWQATGEGIFNFVSSKKENATVENPYIFHPGVVKGIYQVTNIRDTTLTEKTDTSLTLAGVYFDGNVRMENVVSGGIGAIDTDQLVPSKGQFGYVLLADASKSPADTITDIFSDTAFQSFLGKTGPLGGPVDCVVNIGGSGHEMHIKRVEVAANKKPAIPVFAVSANGAPAFTQQGAWSVVKCTNAKDVVPLEPGEMVPLIRQGKLRISFINGVPLPVIDAGPFPHALGAPAEILRYKDTDVAPDSLAIQYAFLQTTPTHKMLFRRPLYVSQPGFINNITNGIPAVFTKEPLLADAFCLLKSRNIFPALDQAFKVAPGDLDRLLFSNNNFSIPDVALAKFDKLLPANFAQLNPLYIVNETALKIYIRYDTPAGGGGPFSLGLSDGAAGRKPWEMTNREVDIVVEVGPLKPLLTVHGTFHADPDGTPRLESPELEWGGDEGLQCMVRILELLSNLSKLYNNTDATLFPDGIKFIPSNAPDSWEYKCSIDQKIPVIQFPDTQFITLTGPPPMIIEASLSLGVFFSLSLNPGNPGMIKPSAGVSFTFEGALQIELITIEAATAYAFGSARVRIEIDILDPAPSIELTVGFGASVAIQLPVIGVVSVTRTVSITSSLSEKEFLVMAGTMLRGKLSLAGGLLTTSIQIEGSAGVKKTIGDDVVKARLDLIFTLDVSLAFVISYDFTRHFSHEVPFTSLAKL